MSKGDTFENQLLETILNNSGGITLVGDAAGVLVSATNGSLFLALHTASVGEAGTQSTNEVAYTGYARKAVARDPSSKQWTVTASSAVNASAQAFPQCTGGTATATHFSIGTATSGAGKVIYHGTLTASLAISNLITPEIGASGITFTED